MNENGMKRKDTANRSEAAGEAISELEKSASELVGVEEAFRRSEERYRNVYDTAPLAFVIWDRECHITDWNRRAEQMFGWTREEVLGRNLFHFLIPEGAIPQVKEVVDGLLRGDLPSRSVNENLTKSGEIILCEWNNSILYDIDGRVEGAISLALDITDRQRTLESLRESEDKYRLLVMNLPGMVFRGYKDWSVEFLDDEVEKLTSYKVEDFNSRKMKWSDVIFSEDIEAAKRVFIEALKTDKSYVRDYRIRAKSGYPIWIRERGQIVCNEAREIRYVDGVFFNITKRKEGEERLLRSTEKFKQFAYTVMHDLKSPAIGIHGLAELLHKQFGDSLDEKGRKYCEQILKASVHLAALVEMINGYIAAKELELRLDKIDVKEVLRTVREQFAPRLIARQIEWMEPEVLPKIKADRLCLYRIFTNLVDNALKYGGEDLSEISIGCEESDEFHTFSVSDNGAGIEEGDLDRIFSQFQRGVTPRAMEGTGLGLAIVRELAERHGGEIWAEPGQDKGTTFYVSLSKSL